jgi:hypothetical protein
MPTVLRIAGFRFFFYAGDREEPEHVHVEGNDGVAKFWLNPVKLDEAEAYCAGTSATFNVLLRSIGKISWKRGMRISKLEIEVPNATSVEVSDEAITVDLSDGRTITVPLAWYPRLLKGSNAERRNWRLVGGGEGIHWEDLDEDISVENLLAGRPSGESQQSYGRWLASRAVSPRGGGHRKR